MLRSDYGLSLTYLILGVVFFLTSLLTFNTTGNDLIEIVYVLALIAFLKGFFELFLKSKLHELTFRNATTLTILGSVDIILSLFILSDTYKSVLAVSYVFSTWFIIDSLFSLFASGVFKRTRGYYWLNIVANVMGFVIGNFLLFDRTLSEGHLVLLVGAYFMFLSLNHLVYVFNVVYQSFSK